MHLPVLSDCPRLQPHCCPSLSTRFISKLASVLPEGPALTLSIGSGSGLLEALLLRERSELQIHAFEVSQNVNEYLPREFMHIVNGTWDLCPLAKEASVWMFCYPKDVGLIGKYARAFGHASTNCMIWIGPVADYQELEGQSPFSTLTKEVLEDCGLSIYEKMVIWRRQNELSTSS